MVCPCVGRRDGGRGLSAPSCGLCPQFTPEDISEQWMGGAAGPQKGMSSAAITNLATTFLVPAFSNSISSLSPSMERIAP